MQFFKLSSIFLLASAVAAGPTKLSTSLKLNLVESPWSGYATTLSNTLGTVKVSTVMAKASLDHDGVAQTPSSPFAHEWEFTAADNSDTQWYPQGITSTADSLDSGVVDGVEALLFSWYHKGNQGVRIGFMNMSNRDYVYALLVEPTSGDNYKALTGLHAGGIMWYGTKLYVVDTYKGIRIFDMSKIMKVTAGSGIGKSGGKYYAHGYKYIIPQTAALNTVGDFRYSAISLDRTTTPDSFIVAEYQTDSTARIARFELDYTTRYLKSNSRTEMWLHGKTSIQGCTSVNGTYYFTKSRGENGKSEILKWNGKASSNIVSLGAKYAIGAEDLSYWRDKNRLWSVAEHPNKRMVWAVTATSL